MNNAEELSPLLTNTVSTRKIDLAGEKALLGVDVPDSLDLPGDMPVFLDYQARWFEDESEVCIAEKSRRTGLTWAKPGVTSLPLQNRAARWPQCVLCGVKAGDGAGIYFRLCTVLPCL
ncbi:portal domain protein [Escherichia coli DEC10A]|nr:portal domain protein [Escherichia coli DEC10A]